VSQPREILGRPRSSVFARAGASDGNRPASQTIEEDIAFEIGQIYDSFCSTLPIALSAYVIVW
jgi:hypothetical protein